MINNKDILKATGGKPELALPHAMARVLSKGTWKPYYYLVFIFKTLIPFLISGSGRHIINMPCRHGKTLLLIYWMVWLLKLYPDRHILFCSHTEELARHILRQVRQIIIENRDLLSIELAIDSNTLDRFHTAEGGGIIGAAVGSALAGLPADFLIIDDVHKNYEESQNQKARQRATDWFCGSAYTRLQPRGSIIVCGARWHARDLSGFLLSEHADSWNHLVFPAVSVGKDKDLLKRRKGAPLSPELFDAKALDQIRNAVGEEIWQSQYQQMPVEDLSKNAVPVFGPELLDQINNSDLIPFEHR